MREVQGSKRAIHENSPNPPVDWSGLEVCVGFAFPSESASDDAIGLDAAVVDAAVAGEAFSKTIAARLYEHGGSTIRRR